MSTYQATMFGQTFNTVSNGLYDMIDNDGHIDKWLAHASKCVGWFDKMCWYARTVKVLCHLTNVVTNFALVYSLICFDILNVESFSGVFLRAQFALYELNVKIVNKAYSHAAWHNRTTGIYRVWIHHAAGRNLFYYLWRSIFEEKTGTFSVTTTVRSF